MKLGIALGRLNPAVHLEVAVEAERLGFESVWLPEHLVFPQHMAGSPLPGSEHPPVPPTTPVFDCFAYLSFIAGRTSRLRLGTHVYLLGLRHPFVAARAIQTLDIVSGGRAEIGIGAGWLEGEARAAGVEFATRGRRLDEALGVCKRLWTDPAVEHHGEFFDFEPVVFEPKPVQKPWPPLHVGGESDVALRRAVRAGDGWIGLHHTLESVRRPLDRLQQLRERYHASHGSAGSAASIGSAASAASDGCARFEITVMADLDDPGDLERWRAAGVDRLIVAPWRRSAEALDGIGAFAKRLLA